MSDDTDRSAGWEHRVPLETQLDGLEEECERLQYELARMTAQRDRLRHAYEVIEGALIAKTERAYMRSRSYPRENWAFSKARDEMRDFHRNNVRLQPGDITA